MKIYSKSKWSWNMLEHVGKVFWTHGESVWIGWFVLRVAWCVDSRISPPNVPGYLIFLDYMVFLNQNPPHLLAFNRDTCVLHGQEPMACNSLKPHYLFSHPTKSPTEVSWPLDNPPADPKRWKASTMKIGTDLSRTSRLLLAVRKPSQRIGQLKINITNHWWETSSWLLK